MSCRSRIRRQTRAHSSEFRQLATTTFNVRVAFVGSGLRLFTCGAVVRSDTARRPAVERARREDDVGVTLKQLSPTVLGRYPSLVSRGGACDGARQRAPRLFAVGIYQRLVVSVSPRSHELHRLLGPQDAKFGETASTFRRRGREKQNAYGLCQNMSRSPPYVENQ